MAFVRQEGVDIDKGSDDELGKVIFSAMIIAGFCLFALVRGCS